MRFALLIACVCGLVSLSALDASPPVKSRTISYSYVDSGSGTRLCLKVESDPETLFEIYEQHMDILWKSSGQNWRETKSIAVVRERNSVKEDVKHGSMYYGTYKIDGQRNYQDSVLNVIERMRLEGSTVRGPVIQAK